MLLNLLLLQSGLVCRSHLTTDTARSLANAEVFLLFERALTLIYAALTKVTLPRRVLPICVGASRPLFLIPLLLIEARSAALPTPVRCRAPVQVTLNLATLTDAASGLVPTLIRRERTIQVLSC